MNTIKTYDAYLIFRELDPARRGKLLAVFAKQNLLVTVDEDALEFEFVGRDLSYYVIYLFKQVAEILVNATGELRCEIDDDDQRDPEYRFYTIRDGKLWEQKGKLIRSTGRSEAVWNPPQKD